MQGMTLVKRVCCDAVTWLKEHRVLKEIIMHLPCKGKQKKQPKPKQMRFVPGNTFYPPTEISQFFLKNNRFKLIQDNFTNDIIKLASVIIKLASVHCVSQLS